MQLWAVCQRTVDFGAFKNKTFRTITLKNETYFIDTRHHPRTKPQLRLPNISIENQSVVKYTPLVSIFRTSQYLKTV
jgi:hypothetical protein